MKTLTIFLLLSLPLLGQTLTFVDDSPSDSPFTWKGTVTYDQNNQASCALVAHNNVSRMIVAYRIEFDVTTPSGVAVSFKHRDDHFFKPQGTMVEVSPQPKLDYQFPDFCPDLISVTSGQKGPEIPAAHIKTLFVQLDDGTVWGESQYIQETMRQRNDAIAYLNSLEVAYQTGGSTAFSNLLRGGPPQQPVRHAGDYVPVVALTRMSVYNDLPDVTSQVNQLEADLALAASRSAWLK